MTNVFNSHSKGVSSFSGWDVFSVRVGIDVAVFLHEDVASVKNMHMHANMQILLYNIIQMLIVFVLFPFKQKSRR